MIEFEKPVSAWEEIRGGARRQSTVIMALIFREFRVKMGGNRLGLMWMLIEPVVLAVVISLIWYLAGRRYIDGIPTIAFIGCGLIPYLMVVYSLDRISSAVRAGKALFNFPQVKPFDALIARYILTNLIVLIAASLLFGSIWWFLDVKIPFPRPLAAVGVVVLILGMSLGLSLVFGVIITLNENVKQSLMFIRRPLIFTSAVLYSVRDLPTQAREAIYWNPLVHLIDYMRNALFGVPLFPEHSIFYPFMVTVVLLGLGMMMQYVYRLKLIEK